MMNKGKEDHPMSQSSEPSVKVQKLGSDSKVPNDNLMDPIPSQPGSMSKTFSQSIPKNQSEVSEDVMMAVKQPNM